MMTNAHELFIGGLSPAHYKRALAGIPTAVVIAGTLVAGVPVGIAVRGFAAVSLDPPLVGFFGDGRSQALADLLTGAAWSFTLLDDGDVATLEAFLLPDGPDYAAVSWSVSEHGTPHIEGAALTIDALPQTAAPVGDHTAVFGRVVAVSVGGPAARPLVMQGGRLARLEPGRLLDATMTQRR